jgi:hypothetical protein
MNKQIRPILILVTIFAALIAACQPQAATSQSVLPSPTTAPAITAAPLPTTLSTAAVPTVQETPIMNQVPIPTPFPSSVEQMVTQARDDLAKQLSLNASQIELVDASSVTWPDSSLGCAQPGMVYAQVMVDGILIRFRANNQVYEYHGGGGRPATLCKKK